MKKVTKPATTTTPAKPAPKPVKKVSNPSAKAPTNLTPATAPAAPAVKPVASARVATTIVAHIDVGFGSTLYIRGEGPGLSWESGVPLDCVDDDKWSITLSGATRPVVFKFLLNDLTWCSGDDFVAQPGTTVTVTPAF